MEAILHGFVLAFGLILPLGVQNLFIFSQGAEQERIGRALPAAITAAVCDTVLILAAIFGLSTLVERVGGLKTALMLGGILFLGYMGWRMWQAQPELGNTTDKLPMSRQVLFAVSVSLLNPHAILDTVGVIGTSALRYPSVEEKLAFAVSCISVSWLWFIGLAAAGHFFKRLDRTGRLFVWIQKASALFVWGTALWLLWGFVK